MAARLDEIADGIYRISVLVESFDPRPLTFNQFVVLADQPLLMHTGMRSIYPDVRQAVSRLIPLDDLCWVAFGHIEGDECGALDNLLRDAPGAKVACGTLMRDVMVDDLIGRPPLVLGPDAVLDLGGRRLRPILTPHVPHNAEAWLLYEEVTNTLFCGDLLAQYGQGPALVESCDVVERSRRDEVALASAPPGPAVSDTLTRLAQLQPHTLAVMHGASFQGDGGAVLRALAEHESMSTGRNEMAV
jgi:flavorubredoxin